MPPTLSAQDFVHKWRSVTLKESAAYADHFTDICRLVGHPTPVEADPQGIWFTLQAGVAKQSGGQGFADVWLKGKFGWEYKGPHANLDRAYQQLLQYRESLQNPPLLVVSDFATIVVHPNFVNAVNTPVTLTLDDLLTPAGAAALHAVFYDPDHFRAPQTRDEVTRKAAVQVARLADSLRARGEDPHRAAHFLIRLLFCLFAEDIQLLPERLFTQLVERTRATPAAFTRQLQQLFGEMAVGGWFGADRIPYFDGGLFDDDSVLGLERADLDLLAGVTALDWSSIEPSIFGTLFERSLDPSKRAQLGAHYTSRDDILLIVEPVLMAPLRRRWAEVRAQADDISARRQALMGRADPASRGQRTRLEESLNKLLLDFDAELRAVRVLDPACGSGNFLYVALRQLLDLEKEVRTYAFENGLTPFTPGVSPAQLYGIEINEYAHELAQATVWIGYIQWFYENGFGLPAEPILKPLDNIQHMDAILAYDAHGNPVEPAWPAADVIIGNPPFLGGNKIRHELGDKYVDSLFKLYEGRIPAFADLVCYWFEKARAKIPAGGTKRAGLLATQGIRGGANRRVLERIKERGDIFWAYADRKWILDGAMVHVSMVGFDDGSTSWRLLDGREVPSINSDLTSSVDATRAALLEENANISFQGPSPKGAFDIEADIARRMLATPRNINGRPNSDVVRPVVSAIDIGQRSRMKWTIDFGLMSLDNASEYEVPFRHVQDHVYPVRSKNRRMAYAEKWWQYAEARPGMRNAVRGKRRYIATPRVSKHRVFVWLEPQVLANDGTIVFARDDDYFFGVLHSNLHELWARRTGTQLREAESGFRYTPTTTFETFPFPWPPGREPQDDARVQAIAQAARDLVAKRDAWLNPPGATEAELKKRTLTNLYNQRPTWLDLAHKKLDRAVLDAYGWPHDLTDDEILARLLALNLERAAVQGASPAQASLLVEGEDDDSPD
jgi:type II restriction/modification system DNA methylase subunit YeeA